MRFNLLIKPYCSFVKHTKFVAPFSPIMTADVPEMKTGEATYENHAYSTITEGSTTILFPKENQVFYNPVQEFNRDMSIAAIVAWRNKRSKEVWERALKKENRTVQQALANSESLPLYQPTILEALGASGLRSIRYAKEIPNLAHIVCNDLDPSAVDSITKNIKFNNISTDLVRGHQGDAKAIMYSHIEHENQYDVVDLDPYGTASHFLDAAVQAVKTGGLLCVTCTDMQVLAGTSFVESCFTKYGGTPLKAGFCHELGLRMLLGTIITTAARYKRSVQPMLSCSIDFYVRVFVRIFDKPAEAKMTASSMSLVHLCEGCKNFALQPLAKVTKTKNKNGNEAVKYGTAVASVGKNCEQCGQRFQVGGPAYNGALHHKEFVKEMLEDVKKDPSAYGTSTRMVGMLSVISEEIEAPLFYSLEALCKAIHCSSISMNDMASAILNAGFAFSISHATPTSIKTNAPSSFVYDVMRAHAKRENVKPQDPGSAAFAILAKESTHEVSFKYNKLANPQSRKIKLVRFQENPTKEWGPKARAGKKRPLDQGNDTNAPVLKVQKVAETASIAPLEHSHLDPLKTNPTSSIPDPTPSNPKFSPSNLDPTPSNLDPTPSNPDPIASGELVTI